MGVPRFYRFLSERYPRINESLCTEAGSTGNTCGHGFDKLYEGDDEAINFLHDEQGRSSNSFAVDCLYLDLNGVLHNATHANSVGGKLNFQQSFDEVWLAIIEYINRLVEVARPQKLLFIAVDGVAPRAKMNQQRVRRFRAAKTRKDYAASLEDAIQSHRKSFQPPKQTPADQLQFDSNCITPGTEFMTQMLEQLLFFVKHLLNTSDLWKYLEVIVSGPDVPGEGEHKIMSYIRSMRTQPGYNPNLSHCIQGLDADLIMLSLLSHEPKFVLLREEVVFGKESKWTAIEKTMVSSRQNFTLLHISLVREYLAMDVIQGIEAYYAGGTTDLADLSKSMPSESDTALRIDAAAIDIERIVDDFLVIACLAGNDFLPHLHFANISDNGMVVLLRKYTEYLAVELREGNADPWLLAGGGEIRWQHLIKFLKLCREAETEKVVQKMDAHRSMTRRRTSVKREASHILLTIPTITSVTEEVENESSVEAWIEQGGNFLSIDQEMHFYYHSKMGFDFTENGDGLKRKQELAENYLEGLQWVSRPNKFSSLMHSAYSPHTLQTMLYYFDGVPSWSWFYGFHYAPYVSHLIEFLESRENWTPKFVKGEPFKPYEQLLGVLPPASMDLIPEAYRPLMTSNERCKEFYPTDFEIDMEGTKVSWGGVTLLPFINEKVLLPEMKTIEEQDLLSEAERKRNKFGETYLLRNKKYAQERSNVFVFETLSKENLLHKLSPSVSDYEVIPSTVPNFLPSVFTRDLEVYTTPISFDFQSLQARRHVSHILSGVKPNPCYPTFIAESRHSSPTSTPSLVEKVLGPVKFRKIKAQSKVVQVFSRITDNESILLDITPDREDDDPAHIITLVAKKIRSLLEPYKGSSEQDLYMDFSGCPLVYKKLPYRHSGRIIAIWTAITGYLPLQKSALRCACPISVLMEGSKSTGFEFKQMSSGPTKQSMKFFYDVADDLYQKLSRNGLYFQEEPMRSADKLLTSTVKSLLRDLVKRAAQITGNTNFNGHFESIEMIDTISWKDILFEIIDTDEVAESLSGTPIMRYSTMRTNLLFYPEIEIVDKAKVVSTQDLEANARRTFEVGDVVICARQSPNSGKAVPNSLLGSLGVVQSVRPFKAEFRLYKTDEDRVRQQMSILKTVERERVGKGWLSLDDIAKEVNQPANIVRWLLGKVNVRTDEGGIEDVGLNLTLDGYNSLTNEGNPLCVPGYSLYDERSRRYKFSPGVLSLVQEITRILPNLMEALKKANMNKSSVIRIGDFFGSSTTSEKDVMCFNIFNAWLKSQPAKILGRSWINSEWVSEEAVREILDAFQIEASTSFRDIAVTETAMIIHALNSPVVPLRILGNIKPGQRVVFIKANGTIPVGATGTVTALYPHHPRTRYAQEVLSNYTAEVLLDEKHLGASTLKGRIPQPLRGYCVCLRYLLPLLPLINEQQGNTPDLSRQPSGGYPRPHAAAGSPGATRRMTVAPASGQPVQVLRREPDSTSQPRRATMYSSHMQTSAQPPRRPIGTQETRQSGGQPGGQERRLTHTGAQLSKEGGGNHRQGNGQASRGQASRGQASRGPTTQERPSEDSRRVDEARREEASTPNDQPFPRPPLNREGSRGRGRGRGARHRW